MRGDSQTGVFGSGRLALLGKTNLRLADPAEDIRGRWVLDSRGDRVGRVSELLVDLDDRRVSRVQVDFGGFCGLGRERRLLPPDELEHLHRPQVRLRHPVRQAQGPAYDPKLVVRPECSRPLGLFGYPPFWGAGQMCPLPAVRLEREG